MDVLDRPATAPLAPTPAPVSTVAGAFALLLGIALVVTATMVWHGSGAVVQAGGVLAGVAVAGKGLQLLGRRVAGPAFSPGLWLAAGWLALVALAAAFADVLPLAESRDVSKTLTTPTLLRPDLFSGHPLGTDRQGLDLLGGVIYGARVSLVVGLGAVAIGMSIGTLAGLVAGYFRGRIATVIEFAGDAMLAFPPLIFLLGIASVVTPSVGSVTVVLAVLSVPTYIRLARANTLVVAQREFVVAARSLGAGNWRILRREVLPNVILPVMSYSFVVVAALIVAEASLSFLGLSIPRPEPTWGNMIAAGQADFERVPHLVFVPGTFLFVTVVALNRVGESLRGSLDPRAGRI